MKKKSDQKKSYDFFYKKPDEKNRMSKKTITKKKPDKKPDARNRLMSHF